MGEGGRSMASCGMSGMAARPDVDLSLRIVRSFLGDVEVAWERSDVRLARGSLLGIEAECARLRGQLGDGEAEHEGVSGARTGEGEDRAAVRSGGAA
jgi:hypothetical protein